MSFAPSFRWADAQQATPSFQAASQGTGSVDQIPVPAVLDSSIYNTPSGKGGAASSPMSTSKRASSAGASRRGMGGVGASPRTSSTPRLRPLHEDLIERGKMYEHRKEAMREHAISKEMKNCRAVPKVSPMARAIERPNSNIVNRLYKLAEEREKMDQYKHEALEKEDQERLDKWFAPKISSLGNRSSTQSKAVRHQQWEQKKQERLAQHRRNILLKELQHVRTAPEINPKSEVLAARAREREGLGSLSHIEAMMERDREVQLKRWENEQRHLNDEAPGTPRITAMAARMHAKTDIFDRLYAMTPPRYTSSKKEAPNPDDLVNDVTRPFQQHTPVITAEAVKRFNDGGLLERQEAYLQKKRERLRKAHEEEDRRHNPNIDPMSSRIAASLPESSETRLTNSLARNNGPQRFSSTSTGRASTPNPSMSRQNTNNSVDGINGGGDKNNNKPTTANELAVYERAVVAEMRRQQRLQKAREEHRQKQLQDCTFQPETTGAAAKVVGPATTPLERMAQRSAEWAKKRDEKLSAMRSQEDKKEVDQLTFQPQIAHPQLNKYESPLYGGDGTPWGVNEYVQRQQEARRQKDERDNVHLAVNSGNVSARPTPAQNPHHQQNNNSNYNNYNNNDNNNNQQYQNFTSPQAPHLGQHPPANIPSLDPPVRPPNHDVTARAPQGNHHDGSAYQSTASNIANQYMRR